MLPAEGPVRGAGERIFEIQYSHRLCVDPRSSTSGAARGPAAQGFFGVLNRAGNLSESHANVAAAVVGIAVVGIEPDRRFEIVQGRTQRLLNQVQPTAVGVGLRIVREKRQGLRVIADGAGIIVELGPSQTTELEEVGMSRSPSASDRSRERVASLYFPSCNRASPR